MKNVLLLCKGLRSPAFCRLQLFGDIVYKDTSNSLKKVQNFGYQKSKADGEQIYDDGDEDDKKLADSFMIIDNE